MGHVTREMSIAALIQSQLNCETLESIEISLVNPWLTKATEMQCLPLRCTPIKQAE